MSCGLIAGILGGCKDYVGGVKTIYLGLYSDFDSGVTVASNVATVLPTATVYQIILKAGTASYVETPTGTLEADTLSFLQTLEFQVPNLAKVLGVATELTAIESILRGQWVVFVEDQNGNRLMMGRGNAAEAPSGEITTGVVMNDLNGYKVTLTATERYPAPHVNADTAAPFDNVTGVITIA